MEENIPVVLMRQGAIEKTNIYSGNCELIDSRTVLYYESDEPIEIEEVFNSSFKILIRIRNENTDAGEMGLRLRVDAEKNTIEYDCINFNNQLGSGTNRPIEIGTIAGKKMYIHFWIYAMGGSNGIVRKLEYSIWKER